MDALNRRSMPSIRQPFIYSPCILGIASFDIHTHAPEAEDTDGGQDDDDDGQRGGGACGRGRGVRVFGCVLRMDGDGALCTKDRDGRDGVTYD